MKTYLLFTTLFAVLSISALYAQAEDISLIAPDGTTVTIERDNYGVPHIAAETETGVFFGQGFAVAQDRLFQMEQFRRAAEGRLSEAFGTRALEDDKFVRTMFYTPEERVQQFADLPSKLQNVFEAYRDGINTYVDSMEANPQTFKPIEFQVFGLEFERWTVYNTIAIIQFFTRIFGQAGGEELERLVELQEHGQEWFDENRPLNDPTAPTTIHATTGSATSKKWSYSGTEVRNEVIESIKSKRNDRKARALEMGLPTKFGSFATLISPSKSSTGNVMLLGAPQMGEPQEKQTSVVNEVELNAPTLHVAGMTIAGVPLVIIGHTDHFAWTLTSGLSDNSDTYIETTMDNSFSKYLHNGEFIDFDVFEETIKTPTGELAFTHYRTVHGPVFADDLENNQAFSMKMTFWNAELDMAVGFYNLIKATTLEEFEAAASTVPFSFNLFYAGQDQKIKFWHIGKFVDRSLEEVDPRLPHNGDGSEEWPGFLAFEDLPHADFTDQDYFVNWNNKPVDWWNHGDNIPWATATDAMNSHAMTRVNLIENFVSPISFFTYDNLKDIPRQINSHGTYQQAIELTGSSFNDENIIPPGQSGFNDLMAQPSPHTKDQWPLHVNWQFKDMQFSTSLATSVDSETEIPLTFRLHQNYPNPFNPATTISYELPEPGNVSLEIYNLNGQLVQKLVNTFQTAGVHEVEWNASGLSSGVYVYRIKAGEFSSVRKSLLLK
ncbi:T9SS type A sorting domain-containing protein [candidate division KSB1 bacterium]|nr:T9SS type A sorting domain-containing protein [candidate division KSB1 bacterium]NIR69818.1 T9SS type A sorting domain-containing protein [candidate division KSB1 bacterium]NIS25809.1 T9SS type A sorting domain-containing protein [candidate division KSB1 bacterium]NIT72683.1 T9SS type A sorting domain-containing protein [candidate division KSB1 bacterium]NIU26498.1 T9SS type A sorting domain-containing protein [candidate division KSB1 bacterium]